MKYFVSIENNVRLRWQAELLIESALMVGVADDLVVAVADCEVSEPGFSDNLNGHKNKFRHHNLGEEHGCPPLNKWYGLSIAQQSGLLGNQFCVLHPDMVLLSPVTSPGPGVTFEPEVDDTPYLEGVRRDANSDQSWTTHLGRAMIFDGVPEEFASYTLASMSQIEAAPNGPELQRAALMAAIAIMSGKGVQYRSYTLEQSMLHPADGAPIVHYRHGMPPYFSKRQFDGKFSVGYAADPYDAMLSVNPSSASERVQQVVRSYTSRLRSSPSEQTPQE